MTKTLHLTQTYTLCRQELFFITSRKNQLPDMAASSAPPVHAISIAGYQDWNSYIVKKFCGRALTFHTVHSAVGSQTFVL